jgi:predicted alpha/beta-fold hydrolase
MSHLDASTYTAPAWLPGGHAQTLWPVWLRRQPVTYRRERLELPDGDFLDLDWVDGPAGAPLVVLFHGLEGSARSHYACALMAALRTRAWRGVAVHFRGCSGAPNRLPRAYFAGDSAEIGYVLKRLRQGNAGAPLHAVGVSLGGNALLKWLGEQGDAACAIVTRAAAISAPLDLAAAGAALDRGFTRIYTAHFLRTLKAKARAMLRLFPGLFDAAALRRVRSIHAYDDLVTAPLHGYRDADDYWRRCSSKPWLRTIRTPTLILNARNDPFMPASVLPQAQEASSSVTLEFPAQGGHVGFMVGRFPGRLDWLPERILAFLDDLPARGDCGDMDD